MEGYIASRDGARLAVSSERIHRLARTRRPRQDVPRRDLQAATDWRVRRFTIGGQMNFYVTSDWHLNHENIKTYCQRPADFTELILKRHNQTVTDNDVVFMLGDVAIGKKAEAVDLIRQMKGGLMLVRGNHDRDKSCGWWMQNGFDFACDSFTFRNVLFTHEPAEPELKLEFNSWDSTALPRRVCPMGREFNVHGHLHNI